MLAGGLGIDTWVAFITTSDSPGNNPAMFLLATGQGSTVIPLASVLACFPSADHVACDIVARVLDRTS